VADTDLIFVNGFSFQQGCSHRDLGLGLESTRD